MTYFISRLRWIPAAFLLCALPFLSGCDRSSEPYSGKPKVIVLVIDSLRYDHLNAYGYERETAPYLAKLAREGTDFTRAYSPSNYTPMSVAGMFLGKPMSRVYDPHPVARMMMPRKELTLAESFERKGYDTFLWSSNLHLRMNQYNRGFGRQFCDYLQTRGIVSIEGIIREVRHNHKPSGNPEFHYIHTMDVHFPYRPPHPYERIFRAGNAIYSSTLTNTGEALDELGRHIISNLPYYSETHEISGYDIRFLLDLYDGAIRYTDDHIAELLDALNYDADRDLLVVTSDHGEQFFSHGYWAHNRLLLPQETHVPLIIKGPGVPAKTITDPVSLLDLYPTLANMFSLTKTPNMTGTDLTAAISGSGKIDHTVYMENVDNQGPSASIVTPDGYLYAFRSNVFLLSPWVAWPMTASLYNIDEDPACENDLWSQEPELATRMHEELVRVNPRWSPYAADMIGEEGRNVEYGPNLLNAGTIRHVVQGVRPVDAAGLAKDGLKLNEVYPEYAVAVAIDEPGHYYALSLDYKINTPGAVFTLKAAGESDAIWDFPITRVSDAPRFVRAAIKIDDPEVELHLRVTDGGKMMFRNVQLRRMHVPEIAPKPDPVVHNFEEADPETEEALTQEEVDALEAIGYVQ